MKSHKLNSKIVGENIRKIRKEKLSETQEKFAEGIYASKDTVCNVERGLFLPSAQVLANLSIHSKVSINQILGIKEPEDKK